MLSDFLRGTLSRKGEADRDTLVALLEDESFPVPRQEKRLLLNVLEVHERVVREIMVPRMDMITVSEDEGYEDMIRLMQQYGHSRLPLRGKDVDKVIGILYAKDFLGMTERESKTTALAEMAREPFFIPETKPVLDLLQDFQVRHMHLAIVVDEYGGVSGLVCLEDILEMIVGDIQDEYDNESKQIVRVRKHYYRIDARASVQQVNDVCKVTLPEDMADTIGGLVMKLSGAVPRRYDSVSYENCRLKVLGVDGNRIVRLQLYSPDAP